MNLASNKINDIILIIWRGFEMNNNGFVGMNIYTDKYNRSIYYNVFDKKGYIITEKNYKAYAYLQNRYLITIAVTIISSIFISDYLINILIGAIALVVLELYFRFKVLPNCVILDKFVPLKENKSRNRLKETSKDKMVIRSIAYIALAILLVLNAFEQGFEGLFFVASVGAAIVIAVLAVVSFPFSIFKK